ncbi:threonine synthase [Flavobacterium cyanobacteriorum]|uniref:Threonine synthase n=1 Tax=Flavobacterium cyanobacteriorum TaxID=2022802 RepID=A0A255YRU8_9FLAO|nr:threonine synthase [Flavobacterium cyanobacteriorum]OYQ31936.1 threonine synthase [Flavobacterium cyanobacteriorum]
MKYYSLNNHNSKASFKEAAVTGIAPDKGLYFPETIPQLESGFINNIEDYSNTEIAVKAITPFIGDEIPPDKLREIVEETLAFSFPLVQVDEDVYALELFHGPTLAFKDVGARFMSRCLRYFLQDDKKEVTVLVATSGDTGGAVASGFLGVEGIKVVILYPSGKVSDVQERQLTTLGQNITALEVSGTFDDCQDMVKQAFLDDELKGLNLTSANSINIARWLPQMFYYFFAYKELRKNGRPLVVSVPSGNFGNICAGMMAKKMGLPIMHFIAATNANDTVPRYMESRRYVPMPAVETLSNAMDVSNPSNFVRILELFGPESLSQELSSYSFTDEETLKTIAQLHKNHHYLPDPHGAVGYLGLKKFMKTNPGVTGVFLETAHPVKFGESITGNFGIKIALPGQIKTLMYLEKKKIQIENYEGLKKVLAKI